MTTTQAYVTDLQAMNPTVVQVQAPPKVPVASQPVQQSNSVQIQKAQTATIMQSTQQQFIVATSLPEQANEQSQEQDTISVHQGGQTIYPHVQYVEGNDPAIYATSNGQMQNYQTDYGQTMYTPLSGGSYYQASNSGQVGQNLTQLGTVQTVPGQIIQHQSGTYLIQGGTMDGEGTPITHTTRASPATWEINQNHSENEHVQWLVENYEHAEGVSLPRSTLYNHYIRHCQEQALDPMNPASFGKLIRSVFQGLRTRRLGTRGNSKYHYYGIRIKASSPLNQFSDDQTMALRQQPMYQGKKFRPANSKMDGSEGSEGSQGTNSAGSQDGHNTQQHQHQQFLGDASTAIPNFQEIDTSGYPLPEGISVEHVKSFEKMYREHAEAVVDVVVNLQFSLIEALWQSFWRNQTSEQITDNDNERRLPKEKLFTLCKYEPVQKFVRRSDYAFYQALVEVLIPDVLRPIPSSLTQAIRNFAKSLESWLKSAMQFVPEEMVKTKIGAVSAFAQTLRRYTSLNHLAQAARAVLQNTSQINQMLTDLNRVDFANVQEQASWVCQCEDGVVQQLEQDFKKTLQQQNSLEQWAVWLEGVVNQVLRTHEDSPNFPKAARQFLLKWSFYSSMVIRDLTLRSAASFGSFHLIRLLYDEYMFYLVEHKVAAATGETPIAVMGEVRQFIDISAVALSSFESEIKPPLVTKTISLSNAVISMAGKNNERTSSSNTPSFIVLTTTSNPSASQNTTTSNGTVNLVTASPATTMTVRATNTTGTLAGTKTIVVMPVSNAMGSGDAHTAIKRLKTD